MAYKIIGLDKSAEGYANKGVICPTFLISALADLAEDTEILNAQAGFYVLATDISVGSKDPATGHWILPAATPILITAQPTDQTVQQDAVTETVSLTCYAHDSTGAFTPTYQWYSNNSEDYTTPSAVVGQTTATLTIPTDIVEASSPYYYFCTITANSKTLNSAIITVTVTAAA